MIRNHPAAEQAAAQARRGVRSGGRAARQAGGRQPGREKSPAGLVTAVQQKVDAVPARESEMIELTRDYGTLQNTVPGPARQEGRARTLPRTSSAARFGEQFKLLDPALLPETSDQPEPARDQLCWGMLAGLGLGAGPRRAARVPRARIQDRRRGDSALDLAGAGGRAAHAVRDRAPPEFWKRLVVGLASAARSSVCVGIFVYTLVR